MTQRSEAVQQRSFMSAMFSFQGERWENSRKRFWRNLWISVGLPFPTWKPMMKTEVSKRVMLSRLSASDWIEWILPRSKISVIVGAFSSSFSLASSMLISMLKWGVFSKQNSGTRIFSPRRMALAFSVVKLTSYASIYVTIEEIICTVRRITDINIIFTLFRKSFGRRLAFL